jgi:predicted protein tyrosine phosphatase
MMSAKAPSFDATICGIEELPEHAERDVSHVLSILDPITPRPEAFQSYGEHERLELRFHDIIEITPEHEAPQPHHVEQMLRFGTNMLSNPEQIRRLLVHCHAGVSRSTAAMTLLLAQAQPHLGAAELFAQVLAIRAKAWPNLRILNLGEGLLGRSGEFTVAVADVYRWQMQRQPQVKDHMINCGRGREVALANGEASAFSG